MDYSSVGESIRVRVQANNRDAIAALVKQLRSPLGVIPFLGAGISAPLRYPQWGAFLEGLAREQLGTEERESALQAVADEEYQRAAAIVGESLGERRFQQIVGEAFSDDRLVQVDFRTGLFPFLPLITTGPVITTNFDRVIEHAFQVNGNALERVNGANPDEVIPAIQQNRPVLWKIHGDRSDSRTRVLSAEEYERHYKDLPELLLFAFLNRPALFIGASLEADRTTEVLRSVYSEHPYSVHYAFVQIPTTEDTFDARVKALASMGIRPIWYEKGEHGQIAQHLSNVVHAASSVSLSTKRLPENPESSVISVENAEWILSKELEELAFAERVAPGDVTAYRYDNPPYAVMLDKITRGRMAFFLGAGATLGRLPLGREFYNHLIAEFRDDPADSMSRYGNMEPERIAQHFVDEHDRDALYTQVNAQLARTRPEPTVIHWFIATLPHRLRARGFRPSQQWIFTTNYDDWMEHTLRSIGQRFHFFSYRVSEPYAGLFVYQRPDGDVSLIDQLSRFRRLPEDEFPVVVKLHGGLHRFIDLPISYVFTHRDFVDLAGRIPAAIPRIIIDRLNERSVLFLGSGLGDDSIESVARVMHAADPAKKSWAVQWQPRPEKRLYWQGIGVKIIDITLQRFMLGLQSKLEAFHAMA